MALLSTSFLVFGMDRGDKYKRGEEVQEVIQGLLRDWTNPLSQLIIQELTFKAANAQYVIKDPQVLERLIALRIISTDGQMDKRTYKFVRNCLTAVPA